MNNREIAAKVIAKIKTGWTTGNYAVDINGLPR